jgi:hypothetical protein
VALPPVSKRSPMILGNDHEKASQLLHRRVH